MKKILLASVAALSLAAAVPAFAQDRVVGVEGQSEAGAVIGGTVSAIPGSRYGYVYFGDRPALVDSKTDTVIWIQ